MNASLEVIGGVYLMVSACWTGELDFVSVKERFGHTVVQKVPARIDDIERVEVLCRLLWIESIDYSCVITLTFILS